MFKLLHKILLAMIVVSLSGLVAMLLIAHYTFNYGFLQYLRDREAAHLQQLAPLLAEHYQRHGDWQRLTTSPRAWHQLLRQIPHDSPPLDEVQVERLRRQMLHGIAHPKDHRGDPGSRLARHFAARVYLLDDERQPLIGQPPSRLSSEHLQAITIAGSNVGWVGVIPLMDVHTVMERNFLRHGTHALAAAGLISLLLAAVLSWLLARHLARPVNRLAAAAARIGEGDLSTRVTIGGGGEIGQLARGFNAMAQSLEANERSRQRWMSDIAHELRTPLSVMRAEIEALLDGVRQPDRSSLLSLQAEIGQLGHLVEDLRLLALADDGALSLRREMLDLGELVSTAVGRYQKRYAERGIDLQWRQPEQPLLVEGDAQRLGQVLNNLLENSLRYTAAAGRCRLELSNIGDWLALTIKDSAPGVAEADLERIFERLYRAEASRNRQSGGSGLGLAIVRSIIASHQGEVSASGNDWGGLSIHVRLPVVQA